LHTDGDPLEKKRKKIALRLLRRGYCPDIASVLTPEGLTEIEKRLDEAEQEENDTKLAQRNGIRMLVSKPGQRKIWQLPVQYDDLPKDPVRVTKLQIKKLEKQRKGLLKELNNINNQIKIVMGYRNSEDQVANLQECKHRIEKELNKDREIDHT
jgi:hypothetical protein